MLFELDPKILENKSRVLVVGDLHGDYDSFKALMEEADLEKDFLVFLGDYADRGEQGVEIIEQLHRYLGKYPQSMVALKGNHEIYSDSGSPRFNPCDLIEEAEKKRGSWKSFFEKEFTSFFSKLYLAAIIPGEVLFVHGGITDAIQSDEDLRVPEPVLENDVLWSDAVDMDIRESTNILRGTGKMFGEELTRDICNRLNVKKIIRSHEPRKAMDGPYSEHNGQIITISSTDEYGGKPHVIAIEKTISSMKPVFLK